MQMQHMINWIRKSDNYKF